MNRLAGFTLIELSIVLIIIGLMAGGVLSGRDLIQAARNRALVSQLEKYSTAINTFQAKYDCLPGDCRNAALFFPGAQNGDGDGRIVPYKSDGDSETLYVFPQLVAAGLVSADLTVTSYPLSKVSGRGNGPAYVEVAYVVAEDLYSAPLAYSVSNFTTRPRAGAHFALLTPSPDAHDDGGLVAFPPWELYAIDAKVDDGLPSTGTAWVMGDFVSDIYQLQDPTSGASGTAACVATGTTPATYNIAYTGAACAFAVQMAF